MNTLLNGRSEKIETKQKAFTFLKVFIVYYYLIGQENNNIYHLNL